LQNIFAETPSAGYKYSCPGSVPLAGFEVATYGRFSGGHRGFWSLVKRQIIGQHHFVSVKHLQRYLNEVSFKFNNREEESVFLLVLLNLLIGSALPYAKLTAPVSAE
jgi:hypothetical protein